MKTKIFLLLSVPLFLLLLMAVDPTRAEHRAEHKPFASKRPERGAVPRIVPSAKTESAIADLSLAAPGDLDPAFGTGGKVITDLPGSNQPQRVAIQPDGKIVVQGSQYSSYSEYSFLIRYNPDGTLDSSFGTNSTVLIPYTPSCE
jgi:uncharacterized delta-60 repeat protein